jgi:hypothetical protein
VGPQDYENPKTSANRMHHKGRRTMDFCMFCVLSKKHRNDATGFFTAVQSSQYQWSWNASDVHLVFQSQRGLI